MAPATTGHRLLIIRIIAYHFGDHPLKLQGFIGIVALQGFSGLYSDRIDTVPYILHTFNRSFVIVIIIPSLKFRGVVRQ
jgi:hypothetical protein